MKNLRRVLAVIVGLAVVVGGFIVADSVVRDRAADEFARQFAAETGAETIDVELEGWPILASFVTGTLQGATIDARSLTVDGLAIDRMHIEASGVDPWKDLPAAKARHLDVAADVTWDELSRMAGVELQYAGDGRAHTQTTLSLFGASIDVDITAGIACDEAGTVSFTDPHVSVIDRDLPEALTERLVKEFSPHVSLPRFEALAYEDLQIDEQGAHVKLVGDDVPLGQFVS